LTAGATRPTPRRVVIVAQDVKLIAAALGALAPGQEPARRVGADQPDAPVVVASQAALLEAVLSGTGGFQHLFLEEGTPGVDASLLDALAEASPGVIISPLHAALPVEETAARIRAVLAGSRPTPPLPLDGLARMADGLQDGGLLLRYQPIVCVRDRRLVMVEALARWRGDPVALGPGSFVPALERAGMARLLAGAVARIAARDMMRYGARMRLAVSVNLPLEELEKRDTLSWIADQLRPWRLPRHRLAIELTETSPVRDFSRLSRAVRRLRQNGHQVLIDDFEVDDQRRRLLRLPFSGVKLDKAFVESLATSARARQQVRCLARKGLSMTAEGVSSAAIWRSLRHLGVERAQGFWLARPLPIAALPAWAERWRGSPSGAAIRPGRPERRAP
jgi:EAL domain-containing protein (putative c-di-GMP-specific phosphodiesterase class I)